ncbi:glycosyl hydrolase family 76, partial [Streptococcus danieliae]|nr:glycosyl hydrolase family 76 [Streptococcus danieliae]
MFQSCGNIEDEYMYDKGLYTINWEAAADSSSVTIINRFWNETGNYFNYESDGYDEAFHYWPQAHAMDVLIDAYIRTH